MIINKKREKLDIIENSVKKTGGFFTAFDEILTPRPLAQMIG